MREFVHENGRMKPGMHECRVHESVRVHESKVMPHESGWVLNGRMKARMKDTCDDTQAGHEVTYSCALSCASAPVFTSRLSCMGFHARRATFMRAFHAWVFMRAIFMRVRHSPSGGAARRAVFCSCCI
jgi:hypothetical protein